MVYDKTAIVIGAGIVGLATALALAKKGYKVQVFERHAKAQGASVRNFGMIWPVGQPLGPRLERAFLSRSIWLEILEKCKIWHAPTGALHLAYHPEEMNVMEEFCELNRQIRKCHLLKPADTCSKFEVIQEKNLLGALYTEEEVIVDPREAIAQIPLYLEEQYGVKFHWQTLISHIENNRIFSIGKHWEADQIFVCTGADFQLLFPDIFAQYPITLCKLQMMRLAAQPNQWKIGPGISGGLSMIHYPSFQPMPSQQNLRLKYEQELPEYLHWGINAMISQNGLGELTVGDSHEYGDSPEPFDKNFLNEMVLAYLGKMVNLKSWEITATWHGIYAKMMNGATELVIKANPHTTIINGLGGNGMTLSFGLAHQCVEEK